MTRVKLHPHPNAPGFYVAHVSVPMVVGDVPGANRVTCIADTKSGALAAAASLAQQIAMDPTIGAVIPDGTYDDMEALKYLATSTRAGISALKAAAHLMPTQRGLAKLLADEARKYGDASSVDAGVAGFFDDLSSLASHAASSVVDAVDPNHWPKWMKNIAKPMARVALDAAATAVLGPVGPALVESTMAVVDKAQSGDPDAAKQIEAIAHKALDGDKKAKVLMSAVATAAHGNSLGDAADDYMAQYGAAYDPATWAGMDNTGYGDNAAPSPYGDNTAAMLSPQDVYALQQAAGYGQPGYTQPYAYGPQMPPQYGPDPYGYGYGYDDGYEQQQPQQQAAPQLNADGTMWWNADHWERVPAGGMPGMDAGYGQPAGYDPSGWPMDPSGQPWPQDQYGQPMDPSQMPQDAAQQAPGIGPTVRAHAAATRGVGPRGGGVTVTAGRARGKGPGFGAGARDSRGGGSSRNAAKNGALWAAFNHPSGSPARGGGGGGGRDHRS